jgi:hypothetical protein
LLAAIADVNIKIKNLKSDVKENIKTKVFRCKVPFLRHIILKIRLMQVNLKKLFNKYSKKLNPNEYIKIMKEK